MVVAPKRFPILALRRESFELAGALALGALGLALIAEHAFGLTPCMLCLWQRWPYYLALPLFAVAIALPGERLRRGASLVLALVFLGSAGLAGYHLAVEAKLLAGPASCGGVYSGDMPGLDAFRERLTSARVAFCDEAAAAFLGLSLAGWNLLASMLIMSLCAASARG